jgi:hypothetical protein
LLISPASPVRENIENSVLKESINGVNASLNMANASLIGSKNPENNAPILAARPGAFSFRTAPS